MGKGKTNGEKCCWRCQDGIGPRHRRDLVRQLDDVLFHLAQSGIKPVGAIHDARRGLKRARATAHLLGSPGNRAESDCFRMMKSAGRLLGPIRDRHVAKAMLGDHGRVDLTGSDKFLVLEAEGIIRAVRTQIAEYWDVSGVSKRTLRGEAETSYRLAQEGWRRAELSGTVEDLHECRKSTKRCYFQLTQLYGAKATPGGRLDDLHRLGDLLGEHHDLWAVNPGSESERTDALDQELQSVGACVFAYSPEKHSRWVKRVIFDGERDKPRGQKKVKGSKGGKGSKGHKSGKGSKRSSKSTGSVVVTRTTTTRVLPRRIPSL